VKGVSPKPFPARLIPFRTKGETPSRAAICREFINGADKVPGSLVVGVNCMGYSGEFEAMEWSGLPRPLGSGGAAMRESLFLKGMSCDLMSDRRRRSLCMILKCLVLLVAWICGHVSSSCGQGITLKYSHTDDFVRRKTVVVLL
jgi:hypothetical protein